jgi:23S rRNA pseudouridine1911/1915/1917 synthase
MAGGVDVVVVDEATAGQRADVVAASMASVGSRRRAREAFDTGKVFVDDRRMAPEEAGFPLPAGARLEVRWNQPGTGADRKRGEARLEAAGLRILFSDDHIVAVDKPPGLLTDVADVQQARERDSVKKRLHAWLRPRGKEALVCHRIDRDTSGVVLFGTWPRAADALREQFATHQPQRFYLVVVRGQPATDAGVWEDFTIWDRARLRLKRTHERAPGAMPTRSSWRVVERFGDAALLEVQLDTGRRNQIRLQAALRGHPLVGERIYLSDHGGVRGERPAPREVDADDDDSEDDAPRRGGGRAPSGRSGGPERAAPWVPGADISFPRQALHAHRVTIVHPVTHQTMTFEAPIPADFQALIGRLRRPRAGAEAAGSRATAPREGGLSGGRGGGRGPRRGR